MGLIHDTFDKYLQTKYFYNAKSTRKKDAQLNYKYTDVSYGIGVRKLILG